MAAWEASRLWRRADGDKPAPHSSHRAPWAPSASTGRWQLQTSTDILTRDTPSRASFMWAARAHSEAKGRSWQLLWKTSYESVGGCSEDIGVGVAGRLRDIVIWASVEVFLAGTHCSHGRQGLGCSCRVSRATRSHAVARTSRSFSCLCASVKIREVPAPCLSTYYAPGAGGALMCT